MILLFCGVGMQNKWIPLIALLIAGWFALFFYGMKIDLWGKKASYVSADEILVKGGCFEMGNGSGYVSDGPVHRVCVNDFRAKKYDVTVGEFREFVNITGYKTEAETTGGCFLSKKAGVKRKEGEVTWRTPGFFQTEKDPVVCVSWNDALGYIEWKGRKDQKKYRLPTEAEWEYAARGGERGERWSGTNLESELGEYAWFASNSLGKTHPVGEKRPNQAGLYDMTGNVWQWVRDGRENPKGPPGGRFKVSRGGDWDNIPDNIQATVRWGVLNGEGDNRIGFRLVR